MIKFPKVKILSDVEGEFISPSAAKYIYFNTGDTLQDKIDNKEFVIDIDYIHTDNNFSNELKNKLLNLQNYVHPNKHIASEIQEDSDKMFVSQAEKDLWNSKVDINHTHPQYLTEMPTHNHNYNEITNQPKIPSKVSELQNDAKYITIDDVNTSLEHSHDNIESLNKITNEKITSWDNKSTFNGDYNSLKNKPNIPPASDVNKQYVDTKDIENKTYTTSEVAKAKIYADDKLVEAKLYADTAKGLSIKHTDDEIVKSNAYTDSKLVEAKTYTDTKSNEALKGSNTYTDSEVAKALINAKSYADTKSTSALNDSKSYTNTKTTETLTNAKTYTDTKSTQTLENAKTFTREEISKINNIEFIIVQELPQTGVSNKVYFVKNMTTENNLYTEYIWVNNAWEIWGSATIDLTPYATKEEVKLKSDLTYVNTQLNLKANLSYVNEELNKKSDVHEHPYKPITYTPSWAELVGKPVIPSKTSQLQNDLGYITIRDIDTSQNHVHRNIVILDAITEAKIAEWNNKSNFDGTYASLTGKPTIPSIEGLVSKTYVDNALASKSNTDHNHNSSHYLKSETKSKTEIDSIVSNINTSISTKVDKITGKGLSTNDYTTAEKDKLATLQNYTHPNTHNAAIIVQDAQHRFTTDSEKTLWNSKADGNHNHNTIYATKASEHTHSNSDVLNGITALKISEWNNKSTFSGNYNDLINKPIIPSIVGLASETYVNSKITELIGSAPDVLNTLEELANALGNDKNFATSITQQIGTKANKSDVFTRSEVTTELNKKANNHEHPYKPSNYIPTWEEVSNKPSTYTPSTHNHDSDYYQKSQTYTKQEYEDNTDKKIKNELDMLEIGSSNFILNSDFITKKETYETDGIVNVSNGVAEVKNATKFRMNLGTAFGALRRGDNISLSSIATLSNNGEAAIGINKFIGGNINIFSEAHEYICSSVSKLKLNMITVPVVVSIDNQTSSVPRVEEWALNRTKEYLRQLKLKNLITSNTRLIFEPHPLINGGSTSETAYNPSNKEEFFTNWKNIILNCLTNLNEYKFYGIYVGTNFHSFDTGEDNIRLWSNLIDEIKSLYKNHQIIYRTNYWTTATWDDSLINAYNARVNNVLWSKVDIIAISAYFELNESAVPTVDALYNDIVKGTSIYNRKQNIFNEVKKFYDTWKKPVMFGELGCPSKEFGAKAPWSNLTENNNNQVVQKNLFEAYNRAFIYKNDEYNNDWFLGYSIFTIGTESSEFNVVDKEAQTSINNGIDFIQTNSNAFIKCYLRDKTTNKTIADLKLPLSPMMNSVQAITDKLIFDGVDKGEIIFDIPPSTTLNVSKPMLTVGKKPSTWCPSPQDPHNDIYYPRDEVDKFVKPISTEYINSLFDNLGNVSDPINYYTKKESDAKYATKEDLSNINFDTSNLITREEFNALLESITSNKNKLVSNCNSIRNSLMGVK